MNQLVSVETASELIRAGHALSVAGPEVALDTLPSGHWVGGTIPYFMTEEGGKVVTEGSVFVTDLSARGAVTVAYYGPDELAGVVGNAPENGFSVAITPAGSCAHQRFAAEASSYEGAFLKPTIGWVSGVLLADIGTQTPKVYDGRTATKYEDGMVVAYVALPESQLAALEIVNIFEPGPGDTLRFTKTSFGVESCLVNGAPVNFAEYLIAQGADHGQLPLVGDFGGAHINVSIQSVDHDAKTVALYAPVFPDVDYRLARPIDDYAGALRTRLAAYDGTGAAFSCNCVLNFLYGELEGKAIGGIAGPITFGEIAYQLLNQTVAVVRVY